MRRGRYEPNSCLHFYGVQHYKVRDFSRPSEVDEQHVVVKCDEEEAWRAGAPTDCSVA
jgi:hypothetical protein